MAICVGCGLRVDPTSGLLEVERRPGGGIGCQNTGAPNDGLYVIAGEIAPAIEDSATIDMVSSNPIRANVRQSSATCNGIRLDGDGVWSPKVHTIANASIRGYQGIISGADDLIPGPGYNIEADGSLWTLTNSSDCTLIGWYTILASSGELELANGTDAVISLEVNINGTGYGGVGPSTRYRMDNRNTSGSRRYEYSFNETNYLAMAPSATFTIRPRIHIDILADGGNNRWRDTPEPARFEFNWFLGTVGSGGAGGP